DMPSDDFVKHFGFCQQVMQRRMGLRGDLPHSVVDVLSEPSLDWLIEASLPLPDASWQSAGLLQLSGSLAAAMDFPRYRCLIPMKRWQPASDVSTRLAPAPSRKTAATATCMSAVSSTKAELSVAAIRVQRAAACPMNIGYTP
ncbi:unnamed protein product, partial [Symbiodinium sp. CCMP2456]